MRFLTKMALSVVLLALAAGCAAKAPLLVNDRSKAHVVLTNAAPWAADIYVDGKLLCWADVGMTGPCIVSPGTHTLEARCDQNGLIARRTLTLRAGESYPWTIRQE